MGEVYRARDTRLDRTVAIKILAAHLSSNTEAKQRFEREARAISSLNHPNICTLHDVGHQDGIDYLVMQFLEGKTLADRLVKGPLLPEQVLKYGVEICEGLEISEDRKLVAVAVGAVLHSLLPRRCSRRECRKHKSQRLVTPSLCFREVLIIGARLGNVGGKSVGAGKSIWSRKLGSHFWLRR
jgi:serine/threonine protein kinase